MQKQPQLSILQSNNKYVNILVSAGMLIVVAVIWIGAVISFTGCASATVHEINLLKMEYEKNQITTKKTEIQTNDLQTSDEILQELINGR